MAGCSINLRANCVRNELTAMRPRPRHRARSSNQHPLLLHQSTRYLIKKLHAPRRSHLIHTMEINPQINVFEEHQSIAGALNAARCPLSRP